MGISSKFHFVLCLDLRSQSLLLFLCASIHGFQTFLPFSCSRIIPYSLILNFQVIDIIIAVYIIYHLQKQFRQPYSKQPPAQNIEASSHKKVDASSIKDTATNVSNGSQFTPPVQNQVEQSDAGGNRVSVHNRMRVPVSYDDLLGESPKDNST